MIKDVNDTRDFKTLKKKGIKVKWIFHFNKKGQT